MFADLTELMQLKSWGLKPRLSLNFEMKIRMLTIVNPSEKPFPFPEYVPVYLFYCLHRSFKIYQEIKLESIT